MTLIAIVCDRQIKSNNYLTQHMLDPLKHFRLIMKKHIPSCLVYAIKVWNY